MLFRNVAEVLEELEKISSGNAMRNILSKFFKRVPKNEIRVVAYLVSGRISGEYQGVVTGMSNKLVLRAVAMASGRTVEQVNSFFRNTGDAGLVAQRLADRKSSSLSVKQVFDVLNDISKVSGSKSQEFKIRELSVLLRSASPTEAKYIARLVVGNLRLGAGDKAILDGLSIAFTGSKEAGKLLNSMYQVNPDIGDIAEKVASGKLQSMGVVFRRPVKAMLAQRVKKFDEIFEKIKPPFAVEEKYDGERMQVHVQAGSIRIFSRRLEDISSQYPDVIEAVRKNIRCKSCILDGEGCAVDRKGNLLNFQVLMQRRRKYDVENYIKKIPVCLFLFDILYLNGKSYLQRSYPERYSALRSVVKRQDHRLRLANRIVTKEVSEMKKFFGQMLKKGAEGIMIKSLAKDAVYRAGVRGWFWIKWKKEYAKGMVDTFDLVVIGAFRGRGSRAGSYGSLLCAVYNSKTHKFETFTKVGSGFTDEQLKELPKKFKKYELREKPESISASKAMKPDVWFRPVIVVEVLGAEITKSPLHTAGGLALRFPRFLRYRDDKSAKQATTVKEVVAMYGKK